MKELLPKSRIDYKIKVTNTGGADMNNIVVSDTIPKNTKYVAGSISDLGVIEQDVLTFKIETLAPGKSVEVGFSVTINADAKKGITIENTAQVNGVDTNKITHYVGAKKENN